MKYIDSFRNPDAASALQKSISGLAAGLPKISIMEVCGTHTMAIARYGIRGVLPRNIDLISGPGCPVCVTPSGYIDTAITLAEKGNIIATFGDMINVPGSESSLSDSRGKGHRVEACYSPMSAVEMAKKNPESHVIFLGIGFETTIPVVTSIVESAVKENIKNISILTAFKLVPPALRALMADPELKINAFLCPAHVSAIIGSRAYGEFTGKVGVPCVIAGFEPLDILMSIEQILKQIVKGEAKVENEYSRVVKPEGNPKALALMEKYLCPEDAEWRGIGVIPGSGLVLRPEFAEYDSAKRLNVKIQKGKENSACLCGDVIKGKCKPTGCKLFGKVCSPDHPVGPCMVSSEGTCAAYFKYMRLDYET